MVNSLIPLVLAVGASASALPPKSFLTMPIVHEAREVPHLMRRDNVVTLFNRSTIAYMIELDIGTPPQRVRVQLDTGSDELWVDPDCTQVSNKKSAEFCNSLGVYDPTLSSTVVDKQVTKELHYGIGAAAIAYVSDHISIPGSNSKTIEDAIFGVATASKDAAVPIMGVGYGKGVNLEYNNLIDEMAKEGITSSRAFSVALGPSSQNNGAVAIFGGIDTKKFVGKMVTFPNLPPQAGEDIWRYWVQLDSVGFTKSGGGSTVYQGSKTPIVIDSGSSYSYLPASVITKLASDFGGTMDSDGNTEVPCSLINQAGSVDFTFGQLTIRVPYKEFIRQLDANVCIMGAQAAEDTPLLGDTFMRSAYVVFDQTNREISMAPYANCGTAEQTLPTAPGAVGQIQGQCTSAASSGPVKNVWMALAGLVGVQLLMAML